MKEMKFCRWLLESFLLGLAAWTWSCAPSASALTITHVNVGDNFFSPTNVTIAVNDKVTWVWIGSLTHSSTSYMGLWDSGIHSLGFRFTNTFTAAGCFPYHCVVHAEHIGSVTVVVTNVPWIMPCSPKRVSATQFQFGYTANPGSSYVVERSADLISVTALATNMAASNSVTFTDNAATLDRNYYYRVRSS